MVGLALLLALLLPRHVSAHANLVRSSPEAGAALQTPPPELVLDFSEDLDSSFSQVQLFDSAMRQIAPGPGQIDPAEPKRLRLALATLPQGSYTAVWRVRSAIDGHVTEGNLPFGVGVAAAASQLPPPGTPDPATAPPPPLESALRWLQLLLLMVTLGGLPFGLFVLRPALADEGRRTNDQRPTTKERRGPKPKTGPATEQHQPLASLIRGLVLAGAAGLLLTTALFLIQQAARAAEVPLAEALGAPLRALLAGRSGLLGLARLALSGLIGGLAWRLPPVERAPGRWWATLGLGAALLLTFSLGSHAAAQPQGAALATAADWLHLAAGAVWLGGLLPLAGALTMARRNPQAAPSPALLVPRFSRLALAAALTLTLTGSLNALQQIGSLEMLLGTTYGRALLLKLGLFGLLLLLGAVNLLVLTPRLRARGDTRALGRTTRAELAAGAALLLAVGLMTSVAPSKVAWQEQQRLGVSQHTSEGDVDLTLRVAPAVIGNNEFAVDVQDRRPGAQAAPTKLLLRFDMAGMEMGQLQTEAAPAGAERYLARGSYTNMGGRWHIEVILRRAGFDDVTHVFEVDLVRSSLPSPPAP
jgi:copper transport protein